MYRLRSPVFSGRQAAPLLLAAAMLATAFMVRADLVAPVMVGERYEAVLAKLKSAGLIYREQKPSSPGTPKVVSYTRQDETVTLEFGLWPDDPDALPGAYAADASAPRHIVLTHLRSVERGSDERRKRTKAFEKEGWGWRLMTPEASRARPAEDRQRYPLAAYLQWFRDNPNRKAGGRVAFVTFLYQAARPVGSPPGSEPTVLDIYLENPYRPRTF